MPDRVLYAYAVTSAALDTASAPPGLDDAAAHLVADGDIGALVSSLDADAYAPDRVEQATEDVGWLAPRAAGFTGRF